MAAADEPPVVDAASAIENEKNAFLELIDKGVFTEFARTFAKAPKYTAESLRTDRDLVLKVVREHREGWRLLRQVTAELRADRELLIATIKGSVMGWRAMAFAAPELREDRELCLEAVRRNAAALELLAPSLRQDREFVSESLASISRRLQAPAPKAAAQDWDRLNNHAPMRQKSSKKRCSVFDALTADRNEEWTERLRREVDSGLCSLSRDDKGENCRVVPLMCLRIKQHNGLILACLGKVDCNQLGELGAKARCVLPGTRILDGEQPRDSLTRFLQTTFAPMAKGLEVEPDFQVLVEQDVSLKFGLPTRYLRSIFKATLDPKFPWKRAARNLGMSHIRSPRGAISATQKMSLGRRFGTGTGGYATPLPPDMYALQSKDNDYGPGMLPWMNKSVTVYAWIPAWEYEWLRSSETGRATLKEWLAEVNIHSAFNSGSQMTSLSFEPAPIRSVVDMDEVDSDGSSPSAGDGCGSARLGLGSARGLGATAAAPWPPAGSPRGGLGAAAGRQGHLPPLTPGRP